MIGLPGGVDNTQLYPLVEAALHNSPQTLITLVNLSSLCMLQVSPANQYYVDHHHHHHPPPPTPTPTTHDNHHNRRRRRRRRHRHLHHHHHYRPPPLPTTTTTDHHYRHQVAGVSDLGSDNLDTGVVYIYDSSKFPFFVSGPLPT